MPNYIGPPLIFDIRKIKAEEADMGVRALYNLTSVDDNVTATGTNASNAYQIRAANTFISNAGGGLAGVVLPQTTGPDPLDGLIVYITNGDTVNGLFVYPNPRDPNNSINALATNTPVFLGPRTITPFVTFAATSEAVAGKWIADGIGAGAAGSIETIVSQGNVATAGSSAGTATAITQAMVNFTSGTTGGTAGGTLPFAQAGMQISVGNAQAGTITIYAQPGTNPLTGSSDLINGSASFTEPASQVTIFFAFVNGAWSTK